MVHTFYLLLDNMVELMKYSFSLESTNTKVSIFVSVDRNNNTERIVITDNADLQSSLTNNQGILFDKTETMGNLLLNFENDNTWSYNTVPLLTSFSRGFKNEDDHIFYIKNCINFLEKKVDTGESSATFIALKTWEEYKMCYAFKEKDLYSSILNELYNPIILNEHSNLWDKDNLAKFLGQKAYIIYTIDNNNITEWINANNFASIILYCLNKFFEWGIDINICSCGKMCLSPIGEAFCDNCKPTLLEIEQLSATAEYKKQPTTIIKYIQKPKTAAQIYDSAYFYWYNRIRKLKMQLKEERAEIANEAFKNFKREATEKKEKVKEGKEKMEDYIVWINSQNLLIDGIMEE